MSPTLTLDKKIILFDGVCNLCNSSVQFIIKQNKNDVFRFVSLQSELGIELLNQYAIDSKSIDSVLLLYPNKKYYIKMEAIYWISKELNGFYSLAYYFRFLGKSPNFIYNFIAQNRYKWFGKKESCLIPNKELLSKFLS